MDGHKEASMYRYDSLSSGFVSLSDENIEMKELEKEKEEISSNSEILSRRNDKQWKFPRPYSLMTSVCINAVLLVILLLCYVVTKDGNTLEVHTTSTQSTWSNSNVTSANDSYDSIYAVNDYSSKNLLLLLLAEGQSTRGESGCLVRLLGRRQNGGKSFTWEEESSKNMSVSTSSTDLHVALHQSGMYKIYFSVLLKKSRNPFNVNITEVHKSGEERIVLTEFLNEIGEKTTFVLNEVVYLNGDSALQVRINNLGNIGLNKHTNYFSAHKV